MRKCPCPPCFVQGNNLLQYRCFQPDFAPRDPNAKPKKYKCPSFYDPYGPRPLPSEKIVRHTPSLPPEEPMQIGLALHAKITLPKLQPFSVEGMDLGLKEAKDLVEKVQVAVILKHEVTKDEASSIIEKIKAVGGVAVIE